MKLGQLFCVLVADLVRGAGVALQGVERVDESGSRMAGF